jgi:hypothetical protein
MHAQPWPNDTNDRSLRATVGPQAKSGHGRFRAASRHWFGRSNHKHTAWPQLAGGALLGAVQALMIVIFGAGDKNAVALPVLLVFPSGAFGGEAPGTDCAEAHGACSADTDAVEPPRRGTSEPRHAPLQRLVSRYGRKRARAPGPSLSAHDPIRTRRLLAAWP